MQKWEEFVERFPAGKAPSLRDIQDRWATREPKNNLSKEDGEQRMYRAWLTGEMEPAEQEYVRMLTLNCDALLLLAVVPTMREIIRSLQSLNAPIKELREAISELQQELDELRIAKAEGRAV